MTVQGFWWQARFGQVDMMLTACLTVALYSFWVWHKERRTSSLISFYVAIALGVFTKGPPALIFPLLMVLAFYYKKKTDRQNLHLITGISLVLLVVAMWLIPARLAISVENSTTSAGDIGTNLLRQTIGRFFLGVSHANPPWYYILQMPLDLFPWSLFLPWTLPWVWKHRKADEVMRFLMSWTIARVK